METYFLVGNFSLAVNTGIELQQRRMLFIVYVVDRYATRKMIHLLIMLQADPLLPESPYFQQITDPSYTASHRDSRKFTSKFRTHLNISNYFFNQNNQYLYHAFYKMFFFNLNLITAFLCPWILRQSHCSLYVSSLQEITHH